MAAVGMRRLTPVALLGLTALFVVGAALAGLLARSAAPTFTSTAVLDIDQPRVVAAASDGAVLDKLSRLRFKYVGLIGTDRIADPVAAALGEDVEQVRGRLGATALPSDLLIRVTGTTDDEQTARRTADALATALAAFVTKEQADDGVPAAQRVVVEVVDVAAPAVQVGPARGAVGIAALLGGALLAGAGLLVALARVRRELFAGRSEA